jgi:hypothetical protein
MATPRQKLVLGKLVENGGIGEGMTLAAVLVAAGYSPQTAKTPTKVTKAKGFLDLLEEVLPDDALTTVHKQLLSSKKIDHMVFPLGPKDNDDPNLSGSTPNAKNKLDDLTKPVERTTLSDQEIKDMIAEVGGQVRRIVHGLTARHVYFWASNDKTRHDALKLAYDLKGKTGVKEPPGKVDNYNLFVQQNNMNPNTPKAKELVDASLTTLMERSSRKYIEPESD